LSRLPRGHFSFAGKGDKIKIRGCDYLAPIPASSSGYSDGQDIFTWRLDPKTIPNSRLRFFCQMYEKYKFTKVKIHFTSAENTAIKGAYVHGIIPDPIDEQLKGRDLLNQLVSLKGHTQAKIMDSSACYLPHHPGVPFMFVEDDSSDPRFLSQGYYHFTAYTGIQAETDISSYGILEIEYEVVFDGESTRGDVQNDYYLRSDALSWTAVNALYPADTTKWKQVETSGKKIQTTLVTAFSGTNPAFDLSACGYRNGDQVLAIFMANITISASGSSLYQTAFGNCAQVIGGSTADAQSTTNPGECAYHVINITSDSGAWWCPQVTATNMTGWNMINFKPMVYITRLYNGAEVLDPITSQIPVQATLQNLLSELQLMKTKLASEQLTTNRMIEATEIETCYFCGAKNPNHSLRDCPEHPKRNTIQSSPVVTSPVGSFMKTQ